MGDKLNRNNRSIYKILQVLTRMQGKKARAPQIARKGVPKAVWRQSILGQLGDKVNHNLLGVALILGCNHLCLLVLSQEQSSIR
jgi:hypothetical protein